MLDLTKRRQSIGNAYTTSRAPRLFVALVPAATKIGSVVDNLLSESAWMPHGARGGLCAHVDFEEKEQRLLRVAIRD